MSNKTLSIQERNEFTFLNILCHLRIQGLPQESSGSYFGLTFKNGQENGLTALSTRQVSPYRALMKLRAKNLIGLVAAN